MNTNADNKSNSSRPVIHSSEGYNWLWNYLLDIRSNPIDESYNKECSEFLIYCIRNYPASSAQLFQDLYVTYKLHNKQNGFFVEFGATNGVKLSNTLLLERQMAWTGIVAEPFPTWHEQLKANRNCIIDYRCVWTESGKVLEFLATNSSPELATINSFKNCDLHKEARSRSSEVISVETVSLNELLESNHTPQNFDYLSIDTEGSELEILMSLNFDKFCPKIITVEHNYNESQREKIKETLEPKGYLREFEIFSKFDDWYYHSDLIQ